jgi:hypothetical protein
MMAWSQNCALKYTPVDEACSPYDHDTGSMMAKFNRENAYCLSTLRTGPWWVWIQLERQTVYTLPFGLRLAPKIFNAVADAMHWIFWSDIALSR